MRVESVTFRLKKIKYKEDRLKLQNWVGSYSLKIERDEMMMAF